MNTTLMRRGALGVMVVVATLLPASEATAHANLDRSVPADGELLETAPGQVSLTFTETPDPELSVIHVLDGTGNPVETGPAEPGTGAKTIVVPLPDILPDGVYTVSWRVVSLEDGHSTAGVFAFGVGLAPGTAAEPSDAAVPATPGPSPLGVAAKSLLYAGLALLVAAAVVGIFAFGGHVPARRATLIGASVSGVLGAILMLVAQARTLDVPIGELISSSTGRLFVRLLVAVVVAGVIATLAAFKGGRGTLALAGGAAALAMLVRAGGGHAAAGAAPALQVSLQWVHFIAVGTWIGGIALAWLLTRERKGTDAPTQEIRRFSAIAGYALEVVLATGIVRAIAELGGLSAFLHLFRTSYGTTLAIKIAVVGVLIGLGAYNRYRSIPAMDDRPGLIRRMMGVELVGAAGVFALTATLTGLPPEPAIPTPPTRAEHITLLGNDFATTMKVRLTVTPGTAGPNGFEVRVTDFDSGAPLDANEVSLRFEQVGQPGVGASTLDPIREGDRWRATGTQLSLDGVWTITVVVQTSAAGTEIPLTLVTPVDQAVSVATAVGQPDLYTIVLPGGEQLQAYNDPGAPGPNQLHLTAFDATGSELPLEGAEMIAIAPDGSATTLQPQRFSPGHFVADTTLSNGDWAFFFRATARDGTVLVASFEQSI